MVALDSITNMLEGTDELDGVKTFGVLVTSSKMADVAVASGLLADSGVETMLVVVTGLLNVVLGSGMVV